MLFAVMVAVMEPGGGACWQAASKSPPALLPGTEPLQQAGDLAQVMLDGLHKFLDRKLAESVQRRPRYWQRDFSSPSAYERSVEPNRQRLAFLLGVRDPRVQPARVEVFAELGPSGQPAPTNLAPAEAPWWAYYIRWSVFPTSTAEGLVLIPKGAIHADLIAVPDADQTPEELASLPCWQDALRSGCRIFIPALVSRTVEPRAGRAKMSHREYIYRPAYELGRHIIGYEIQAILSLVDALSPANRPIALFGYGEGGLLAFYAAALDKRINAVAVSGYFAPREQVWKEPIERNVFGLLEQFGDAEIGSLIAPRTLIIEACSGPQLEFPSQGGAPGKLSGPNPEEARAEFQRMERLLADLRPAWRPSLLIPASKAANNSPHAQAVTVLLRSLGIRTPETPTPISWKIPPLDSPRRQKRLLDGLDRHTQELLSRSEDTRREFMRKLDTSSLDSFVRSQEYYRRYFAEEVIGQFDEALVPAQARSRLAYQGRNWHGYDVVLQVWPEVIAYGILLVPDDIKSDERRPVVVCQHGLEGRPQHVISGKHPAYNDFAAQLAEAGFVVFAPQNPYIFGDTFRSLQRKCYPLKKTLFSLITAQHRQILNWLQTLPFVDKERIGFYGLSYGGKTAMRVPALLTDYKVSICSADFNDWIWKNASTRSPYSYVWTGEYEIFEFDLGNTFNYSEMAALICPRPFMVERGHFDGVAPDERVAYEFAKVRHLYQARLGIGDRCRIEWFVGGHTIHGQGTFAFLCQHLRWPMDKRPNSK